MSDGDLYNMLPSEMEVVIGEHVCAIYKSHQWPRPGDLMELDDHAGNHIHVRVLRMEHFRSQRMSRVHVERVQLTPDTVDARA